MKLAHAYAYAVGLFAFGVLVFVWDRFFPKRPGARYFGEDDPFGFHEHL